MLVKKTKNILPGKSKCRYILGRTLLDVLVKIINQRSIPGTLIFDRNNRLLFLNKEAHDLLQTPARAKKGSHPVQSEIPKEILCLCDRMKERIDGRGFFPQGNGSSILLKHRSGSSWSARAFLLDRRGEGKEASHIMILLERVVEKHTVNLQEVALRCQLSLREVEVVGLVCEGLTNREIGEKLYISEHTVKDHLKNIMRKMKVATRNEIVAVLI
jgi:DNA-binding CsgD family transcriptional regulator